MWLPCRLLFPKQVYNEAVGVSNEICVYLRCSFGEKMLCGRWKGIYQWRKNSSLCFLVTPSYFIRMMDQWSVVNGPASLGASWCFCHSDLVWTHLTTEVFLIFKSTTEGRLYILNSALYQWRPLCFHCLVSLVVALSGLPTLRPALSSRQFNKTALFMLVGFSTGNGFPQWASLFHQVSHFYLCSAGPPSRSHPLPLTLIS